MKDTNLLTLITKDSDSISDYLAEVSTEQFKQDVRSLIKESVDKQVIQEAIKKLQAIL